MYKSTDCTIYIHDKKSETYPAPLPPPRPLKIIESSQEDELKQKTEALKVAASQLATHQQKEKALQKETASTNEMDFVNETPEHPGKLPEIFQLARPSANPAVSACTIPGYELPSEPSANVEACERDLTFEAVMSRRQRVETRSDSGANDDSSLSNLVF